MILRINRALFPVTSLGPGRRIGLWLQGCSIGCPGCASRDTWPPSSGQTVSVPEFLAWCREVAPEGPDGVTISGGEPFEQAPALQALLDSLSRWRGELLRPFDILCYSGLPLRRLQRQYSDIVSRLDALVPEPFVRTLPRDGVLRGSTNQPLLLLTPLARERFAVASDEKSQKGTLQIRVEGDRLTFVGIPDRDDLERVTSALRTRGIELEEVSWRA